MRVLVVYASRYGATVGIAERITGKLNEFGHQAEMTAAEKVGSLDGYDAFIVGSAVYIGSWMKQASDFVRRNSALLATRPVWLFSSGPVGTRTVDDLGRDVLETAVPKEIAELEPLVHPRGHRVFFGAMDHTKFSVGHRVVFAMPAMKKLMVDGDYRDWQAIDDWAKEIAAALVPAGVL